MDQETVKISALKAIFDLLHFFGLEAFKLEMVQEEKTEAPSTPDRDVDRSGELDDFDDLHSENSSQPPQQQETSDIGADILTILTDLLDSNVSQLVENFLSMPQSVTCKLCSEKCVCCWQLLKSDCHLVVTLLYGHGNGLTFSTRFPLLMCT